MFANSSVDLAWYTWHYCYCITYGLLCILVYWGRVKTGTNTLLGLKEISLVSTNGHTQQYSLIEQSVVNIAAVNIYD